LGFRGQAGSGRECPRGVGLGKKWIKKAKDAKIWV